MKQNLGNIEMPLGNFRPPVIKLVIHTVHKTACGKQKRSTGNLVVMKDSEPEVIRPRALTLTLTRRAPLFTGPAVALLNAQRRTVQFY